MMIIQSILSVVMLGDDPTLSELLRFSLTGLFVVLFSLGIIAVFCSGVGYAFQSGTRHRIPESASSGLEPQQDADELVAVIAAAAAEALAVPHRIVSIRGLTPEDMERTLGGRMQHHISHHLPRRSRTPPNR